MGRFFYLDSIMNWFFKDDISEKEFEAYPEESKHIAKVLRMSVGDQAAFINGKGFLYTCNLLDANAKKCRFAVVKKEFFPKSTKYNLHLVVAPTKNISRFEWFIEKACEIGITEITPIQCEHSERIRIKKDRLEKIIISAMKQSQQVWMPKLNELVDLSEFLNNDSNQQYQKFIAYVSKDHQNILKDRYLKGSDAIILIGPEGDFSDAEIKTAIGQDYEPISLGENRLRTETAALVACHTIVLLNQ